MSTQTQLPIRPEVVYPESDGEPMADNTLQFEWITTIKGGLDALFREDPDVFVAGDLLWYPVEGDATVRAAPDVMVAFGRPKGDRGSYQQWREGGIAPQVVFEVLSPGNRVPEMIRKFQFYERHGVEEYYVYDPDADELAGWVRRGERLEGIADVTGWTSPRLQVRFEPGAGEMQIYGPDGEPFLTYVELAAQRTELAAQNTALAEQGEAERQRAERLAEQLRALGVEPEL